MRYLARIELLTPPHLLLDRLFLVYKIRVRVRVRDTSTILGSPNSPQLTRCAFEFDAGIFLLWREIRASINNERWRCSLAISSKLRENVGRLGGGSGSGAFLLLSSRLLPESVPFFLLRLFTRICAPSAWQLRYPGYLRFGNYIFPAVPEKTT